MMFSMIGSLLTKGLLKGFMIQKSAFIVSPSDFHTAAALLSVYTVAFRSSVLAPFPVVSLEFFMKRQLLSKSTNDMIVIRKTREVSILLGKQKCRILKEIRQRIADENDIPFVTQECRHRGECSGTCPRCESELRYLEQQLDRRAALGKRITVAALCAGIAFTGAGCVQDVPVITPAPGEQLSGEVAPYETVVPSEEPELETSEVAPASDHSPAYSTASPGTNPVDVEEFELSGMVPY